MSNIDYLDGYIYHMVHLENLRNIFERRALLSKEKVLQEKIVYHSIANEEVQGFRDRIFIWDFSKQKFRSLHSYVPFYFAIRPPMLHNKYTKGVQDKITIFEVSRSILRDRGVLFTNGNASNQQLSKYRDEKVGIVPATVFREECQREYRPNGPYRTGVNRSDFFSDVTFLERLDWDGINDIRYIESLEEYIRVRHAEVLVPDLLPLGRVEGIVVKTRDMVQAVNALIDECGLTGRLPSAVCKPGLYF
jgi:ssDNA thymidine ADP-ribosyltransferase, DarT